MLADDIVSSLGGTVIMTSYLFALKVMLADVTSGQKFVSVMLLLVTIKAVITYMFSIIGI